MRIISSLCWQVVVLIDQYHTVNQTCLRLFRVLYCSTTTLKLKVTIEIRYEIAIGLITCEVLSKNCRMYKFHYHQNVRWEDEGRNAQDRACHLPWFSKQFQLLFFQSAPVYDKDLGGAVKQGQWKMGEWKNRQNQKRRKKTERDVITSRLGRINEEEMVLNVESQNPTWRALAISIVHISVGQVHLVYFITQKFCDLYGCPANFTFEDFRSSKLWIKTLRDVERRTKWAGKAKSGS